MFTEFMKHPVLRYEDKICTFAYHTMPKYEGPEVQLHEFLSTALNDIELSNSHYESFDVGQGPTAHFGLEMVWANKQSPKRWETEGI
jgi:hypothetical protein